jgi:hypothetical protein
MMVLQHTGLGEGFEPMEKPSPLTHQHLLQCLLALSRKGRGRNKTPPRPRPGRHYCAGMTRGFPFSMMNAL